MSTLVAARRCGAKLKGKVLEREKKASTELLRIVGLI
jgi:hypothetical protein